MRSIYTFPRGSIYEKDKTPWLVYVSGPGCVYIPWNATDAICDCMESTHLVKFFLTPIKVSNKTQCCVLNDLIQFGKYHLQMRGEHFLLRDKLTLWECKIHASYQLCYDTDASDDDWLNFTSAIVSYTKTMCSKM